jgi:phage gp45-like
VSDILSLPDRLVPSSSPYDAMATDVAGSIHVAIPGIVKSFDATRQTATVQTAVMENVRLAGLLQTLDLGVVADVPVVLPRAGGFSLTLPVAAGDECLLVFADGCIDAWFQSGGQQSRIDGRRHALPDAFAILGPWSQPRKLSTYSTAAAQLRSDDGQTVVEVGAVEVTIKAATVTVQATGTANVSGQHVNVTGSSQVSISGSGHTSIEGRDFLTHEHTNGTTPGTGTTGPVI